MARVFFMFEEGKSKKKERKNVEKEPEGREKRDKIQME